MPLSYFFFCADGLGLGCDAWWREVSWRLGPRGWSEHDEGAGRLHNPWRRVPKFCWGALEGSAFSMSKMLAHTFMTEGAQILLRCAWGLSLFDAKHVCSYVHDGASPNFVEVRLKAWPFRCLRCLLVHSWRSVPKFCWGALAGLVFSMPNMFACTLMTEGAQILLRCACGLSFFHVKNACSYIHDRGCPNFAEVRLRAQPSRCQKCLLVHSWQRVPKFCWGTLAGSAFSMSKMLARSILRLSNQGYCQLEFTKAR